MKAIPIDLLLEAMPRLALPCFVYDPEVLAENVRAVRTLFPRYHYPVKTNALPAFVHAAVSAGADLDLCSDGDIQLAEELRALSPRSSYTGSGLTPELLERIAATGCRVNLDSLHEVRLWAGIAPDNSYGLRLQTAYDVKFGVTPHEVSLARSVASQLTGVHFHDNHRGRTPREAAATIAAALQPLSESAVQDLQYVSLGGGWPHAYEDETEWDLITVADAFEEGPVRDLREKGFRGEILYEPGEFITAPAGVWLARVATVKTGRPRQGEAVVILDTPTPMPCADFAYPVILVRGSKLAGGITVRCAIYGSTNSGRDRIRRDAVLPEPRPDDIMIIRDTGAYVQALISTFNERRCPSTYVLPLP